MMQSHIGAVLAALEPTGALARTAVIYTSDHGEALGERAHWGKSNLYAVCTQVPLVIAGPDVPAGTSCEAPVNLVDLAPTFLAAFGSVDAALPGRSLFEIALEPPDPARTSFSEYHAVGAPSGAFMLRKGRWKYHEHVHASCSTSRWIRMIESIEPTIRAITKNQRWSENSEDATGLWIGTKGLTPAPR